MSSPWVQRQFDATRFTGVAPLTWTVEAGDVITDAYAVVGNTATVSFVISSSTTSGTAGGELRIALPSSLIVLRTMSNPVRLFDTAAAIGYAQVQPGWTYVRITKLDASNFVLATNSVTVQGQITFEIDS